MLFQVSSTLSQGGRVSWAGFSFVESTWLVMRQLQCYFYNEKGARSCLEKVTACRFHTGDIADTVPV